MRIAQISPLFESVPPRGYGGTERVVSYLTEALVALGHDITLFASGDSETSARLISCAPRALRADGCIDPLPHHLLMLEAVYQRSHQFDLVHFHCDYVHLPMSRRLPVPTVTTLHGRLDIPDIFPLYRHFRELPLVSISNAQRRPLAWANWAATVYHGLPPDLYQMREGSGDYLAVLGRISPEKGVERAVEIARQVGLPLRVAAKVDPRDRRYFEREVRDLLRSPGVEFVGEIGEHEKEEFLGDARALLFPIDWPEPFGLVMIESMACGTPVIAFRRGSVPEIMEDGVTGFIVDDVEGAIEAVNRVEQIDRHRCREVFEQRFSASRMAADYLALYDTRLGEEQRPLSRETPDESAEPEPVG
jgi:glycosyltransferase involved in cell wall biosynthesis